MPKRQLFCNILGGLGYLSCLLQWLWAVIIWAPTIMNARVKELLVPEHPAYQLPAPMLGGGPPLLVTIIAVTVTAVVMAATVVVLLRMPGTITRSGQKLTRKSADLLLSTITHHEPVTKKKRRRLTTRLIKAVKLALVLLPFWGILLAYTQRLELGFSLVVFIAGWLAIGSMIWFVLQYLFARLLRVSAEKLA